MSFRKDLRCLWSPLWHLWNSSESHRSSGHRKEWSLSFLSPRLSNRISSSGTISHRGSREKISAGAGQGPRSLSPPSGLSPKPFLRPLTHPLNSAQRGLLLANKYSTAEEAGAQRRAATCPRSHNSLEARSSLFPLSHFSTLHLQRDSSASKLGCLMLAVLEVFPPIPARGSCFSLRGSFAYPLCARSL